MVQGAVGGGATVRVAEGPAAADAVGHLEAVGRDVAVGRRLGDRDAARAGADDADLGPGGRGLGRREVTVA
jgi:hypothetical protein